MHIPYNQRIIHIQNVTEPCFLLFSACEDSEAKFAMFRSYSMVECTVRSFCFWSSINSSQFGRSKSAYALSHEFAKHKEVQKLPATQIVQIRPCWGWDTGLPVSCPCLACIACRGQMSLCRGDWDIFIYTMYIYIFVYDIYWLIHISYLHNIYMY